MQIRISSEQEPRPCLTVAQANFAAILASELKLMMSETALDTKLLIEFGEGDDLSKVTMRFSVGRRYAQDNAFETFTHVTDMSHVCCNDVDAHDLRRAITKHMEERSERAPLTEPSMTLLRFWKPESRAVAA